MTTILRHNLYSDTEDEEEPQEDPPLATETEAAKKRKAEADDDNVYTKKRRQPRPKLTIEHLTGINGLPRIPSLFHKVKMKGKDMKAAAAYSRSLMNTYQLFAYDLLPDIAFEDVMHGTEQLGSKSQVKKCVQDMRDSFLQTFVEKKLGRDKADKLLRELEVGLQRHGEESGEPAFDLHAGNEDASSPESAGQPSATRNSGDEPTGEAGPTQGANPVQPASTVTENARQSTGLSDDSDSENELEVESDPVSTRQNNVSLASQPAAEEETMEDSRPDDTVVVEETPNEDSMDDLEAIELPTQVVATVPGGVVPAAGTTTILETQILDQSPPQQTQATADETSPSPMVGSDDDPKEPPTQVVRTQATEMSEESHPSESTQVLDQSTVTETTQRMPGDEVPTQIPTQTP